MLEDWCRMSVAEMYTQMIVCWIIHHLCMASIGLIQWTNAIMAKGQCGNSKLSFLVGGERWGANKDTEYTFCKDLGCL